MTIGRRIRILRKELSLTQAEFGDKIGLKQAVIGQMENNTRNITDRTILLICEKYSVSKQWLCNGIGEMFVETDKTVISSLVSEYNLDALDQKIVECYLNLDTLQRKVIKDYLRSLVDAVLSDENYDDYREEYVKENAGAVAARGGHSEQIGELKDLYDNGDSDSEKK